MEKVKSYYWARTLYHVDHRWQHCGEATAEIGLLTTPMPTFESLNIHPSVKACFLASQKQDDTADGSDEHDRRRESFQREEQPARSRVLIPRSLLTRDPNALVDMVTRGNIKNEPQRAEILAQMESVRNQVARNMISRTRNGKRLLSCQQSGQKRQKRGPLIPGGSISIQEAWKAHHKMVWKQKGYPEIYSTGSGDLDSLIAFPAESFSQINDNRGGTVRRCVDMPSGEIRGIPTGHVLKLSGTSGKTQLAIQFASQSILRSFQKSKGKRIRTRIRYCYSTAGHSGYSLAQRFLQLIKHGPDNSEKENLKDMAKCIEFQPIATVAQLVSTVAKLEKELSHHTTSDSSPNGDENDSHQNQNAGGLAMVSMIVMDAMPFMALEGEDAIKMDSLERWLKRLARQYSIMVVITTHSRGTGFSSIQNNSVSPDVHLHLQKLTPSELSVRLLRHPTKSITEKDWVSYTLSKLTQSSMPSVKDDEINHTITSL